MKTKISVASLNPKFRNVRLPIALGRDVIDEDEPEREAAEEVETDVAPCAGRRHRRSRHRIRTKG